MVMRLNPTELCSYAIAALIAIATITVATWIVMTGNNPTVQIRYPRLLCAGR